MLKHTHMAFSLMVGASTLRWFPPLSMSETFLFASGLVIGALIPDIDHPKSTLGRWMPLLSKLISIGFGHRGFSHSFLFLGLIFLLLPWVPNMMFWGGVIGIVTHLIGDMMTHKGIRILYPYQRFFRLPVTFKTGGMVEHLLFPVFCFVAVVQGFKMWL